MKKHEKKRLQGIKLQQKVAKAKKHVSALIEGKADEHETLANAARALSNKDLKTISACPERFSGYGDTDSLVSAANDVLAERAFKLSQ